MLVLTGLEVKNSFSDITKENTNFEIEKTKEKQDITEQERFCLKDSKVGEKTSEPQDLKDETTRGGMFDLLTEIGFRDEIPGEKYDTY